MAGKESVGPMSPKSVSGLPAYRQSQAMPFTTKKLEQRQQRMGKSLNQRPGARKV